MHWGKYPKPLSLFSHAPEVMTHRILQREMYKTLIFPLVFDALILYPSGQSARISIWCLVFETRQGTFLTWFRGRIVSPSLVGVCRPHSEDWTRDESHIFFINFIQLFAVNNEVETRREEPGYEVAHYKKLFARANILESGYSPGRINYFK